MIRGEKLIYIGESIEADIHCVQELGSCLYRNAHISVIEKPETPEQKAERERQHAVYDMCSELDNHTDDAKFWCEKLYDLGYRKQ